jgi:hypothetical protein
VDAIKGHVDDPMLRDIAAADYRDDFEEHLAQLRRIRDEGEALPGMSWHPGEVLRLTRWSEPDKNQAASSQQKQRAHIMRAFACAALLRANGEYLRTADDELLPNQWGEDGENHTLVQLLASLSVIGLTFQVAALRFIAWRTQDLTDTEADGPFFILALLVLVLRTQADLTVAEVHEIIDNLYALERQIREERPLPEQSEPWLLGVTFYNLKHDVWKRIGQEIGAFAVKYEGSGIEPALLDIARRLTDESGNDG